MAQLLVFGFHRTTKAGKIFSSSVQELERLLERGVIAKGGAASFDLPKDYIRFRSFPPRRRKDHSKDYSHETVSPQPAGLAGVPERGFEQLLGCALDEVARSEKRSRVKQSRAFLNCRFGVEPESGHSGSINWKCESLLREW
jgi:hypothetical protein